MATTIGDLKDGIDTLTELLTKMDGRISAIESTAKPSTNDKRKKSNGGASKLSSVFKDVTPEGSKYIKVSAWYVIPGQEPYEKVFWGKKKMAKYDWGLSKLHRSFKKYTDMPSI